jgi:hypothetical protein
MNRLFEKLFIILPWVIYDLRIRRSLQMVWCSLGVAIELAYSNELRYKLLLSSSAIPVKWIQLFKYKYLILNDQFLSTYPKHFGQAGLLNCPLVRQVFVYLPQHMHGFGIVYSRFSRALLTMLKIRAKHDSIKWKKKHRWYQLMSIFSNQSLINLFL